MSDQPNLPPSERHARLDAGFQQRYRQAQAAATDGFQSEVYNFPRNGSNYPTSADHYLYRASYSPQPNPQSTDLYMRDPYRFAGTDANARDPYRFAGPEANTGDRPQKLDGTGNEQIDHARQVLMNDGISAGDKLRVIQGLAAAGVDHIQLPDKDGNARDYNIRTEAVGNRMMVHLFAKDDQGREHVALRGIANADGTFEKERDNAGRFVTFEGTWWSQHMAGRAAFAQGEDRQNAGPSPGSDPYRYDGGPRRRGRNSDRPGPSDYAGNDSIPNPIGQDNFDPSQRPRSQAPSVGADALADVAARVASAMGTVGYCARGVASTLDRCGIRVPHANAWEYGHNIANSGMFDRVPLSEVRRGDIIVRSWNRSVQAQHGGKNWGDITMVTGRNSRGQLMGANDHHQVIPADGGRYVNSFALRIKDSNSQYA